mgnify:FL=1
MAKKIFVIDTSVYLSDFNSIFKFDNNDIIVPIKVLEEIDKHKKRQDGVGVNARNFIRVMDSLREKGDLKKGIRIDKGKGILKVISFDMVKNCKDLGFPSELSMSVPDHMILATAFLMKKENPRRKVLLVSRDINMRVISDSIGIPSQDYVISQVVENPDMLYGGFEVVTVDDQLIEQHYANEEVVISPELAYSQKIKLYPNQFLMLQSSSNNKKTALVRFKQYDKPLKKVTEKRDLSWGVHPRNKEQNFAYDLLFDENIPLVTMIGKAGSGKTLIAIAAGLEQTLGLDNNKYNKIVVSRPVQPMGKDIGFLPGSMHDKMMPWLMPIQDNMEYILGHDKVMFKSYLEKGQIQIEALTYIRGRSISNAFMIIDEAQNLTAHEVKTIITRVGENTKLILTGDIEQIDNVYTNETNNGLAYAIEKFKYSSLAGHITFLKGERSKLATEASKIL